MYLFIGIVFAVLFLVLFGVVIESIRENKNFAVSEYLVSDERIRENAKMVFISDLHGVSYGKDNDRLIKKIDEINPDIILSAGDLIVGKPSESVEAAISLLNTLGSRYPVYIGKGNHEMRISIYDQYGDMWERLYNGTKDKVTWLINEGEYLDSFNIKIYGLDIKAHYYKRFIRPDMDDEYLKSEMGTPLRNEYTILLAHNPDYFPEYAAWGADLSLSGHVHGGLMIIPKLGGVISPMIKLFPKYYKGLYSKGDKKMIVSGGLGLHTLKIRVNNKPDLVSVTLMKEIKI